MQKDSLQREKIKRLIISLVIFLVIGALIISGYCLNERRKQQLAIEQTIEEFEEYKENIIGEDIKTVENYIKKISADKDNEDASAMDYYNYHDGYYRGPEDIREECAAHSNPAWLEKYICNQKSNSHE